MQALTGRVPAVGVHVDENRGGLLDVHVAYGSLEGRIESAVAGKVVRSPSPWNA